MGFDRALVQLASNVLNRRSYLHISLESAHRATNEVRSGQVDAGEGFECWLMKWSGTGGYADKAGVDAG